MEELAFLSGTFVGMFAIGYTIGFKLLIFKKAVESIASN